MSLSTVVSDLEAEGCNELSTACFITSRSVTKQERARILEDLLDSGDISHNEEAGTVDQWKAVATTAGLALAQPSNFQDTAAAACACGGTILYYASPVDLDRGEGLFDTLAPAMEKIMSSTDHKQRHLYVLVESPQDKKLVRQQLESVAQSVLANLITPDGKPVTTLREVFDHVDCIAPSQAGDAVIKHEKTTPTAVAAQVAQLWNPQEMVQSQINSLTYSMTGANLAAARTLVPAARRRVHEALQTVTSACSDETGNMKLVMQFGLLGDAALRQADSALYDSSLNSATAKQIRYNLQADLNGALQDMFNQQLDLLQVAQFEEFKRSLSKLLVSPNLQNEMEAAAKKSIAAFAAAAKKLVPKRASGNWNVATANVAYARKLKAYVANRVLNARASGKFKPLPRKGVTVGLHWLLPKPFGNDYRQEPWMVHAVDDMVYVPSTGKLADVNPQEVEAGDWRDKIVPSPAGNDMIYMQ